MPKRIVYTDEELLRLAEEYLSGDSLQTIATRHGVAVGTIQKALTRAGVTLRPAGVPGRNLPMDKIITEYAQGDSTLKLAERYGVSHTVINGRLRDAGVQMRHGYDLPMPIIVAAYERGESAASLGRHYNVSGSCISDRLRIEGIDLRTNNKQPDEPSLQPLRSTDPFEIIARLDAGESFTEIAALYKVGVGVVRTKVRRVGYESDTNQRRIREMLKDSMDEIRTRYEAGEHVFPLAREFGFDSSTLSKHLRDAGLQLRGRRWGGGRQRTPSGYVNIAVEDDDPLACMKGSTDYVPEHRMVMARHLGRPLTRSETVHHKNGVRDDNRLENLQLRQGNHGRGANFVCGDCGSYNIESEEI